MVDAQEVDERVIAVPGSGVGDATETLVNLARTDGYDVTATGPGSFRLVRSSRPRWAVAGAVLGAPIAGLGLLLLLVRRRQEALVTVYEDRAGTKIRIVGRLDEQLLAHLDRPADRPEQVAPAAMSPVAAAVREIDLRPAPPADLGGDLISGVPGGSSTPIEPQPETELASELEHTVARPLRSTAEPLAVQLPDGTCIPVGHGLVIGRAPVPPPGPMASLTPLPCAEPSLSKTHVALQPAPGGVIVTDLHSTNGTLLRTPAGDLPCEPGRPTPARRGTVVHAGELALILRELPCA
ncbi:MAG: FHA domain-containing protein [Acidimicrobiales bacterium]|nr:FHA domain-containing protein [Acidimicrobiales bacterium]